MSPGDRLTATPLVSILTPSFNQGRWLPANLASVQNQTYPFIEHLVMDGGSSDDTLRVLEGSGPNVTWLSEKDEGQSHALTKAFNQSRGEIIGWINSDDAYFSRDAVESAVDLFVRHPEIDVLYGHAAVLNAEGQLLHFRWVPRFSEHLLKVMNFIPQPAAFIRRTALNHGFVDPSFDFTMDRELWLRLSSKGATFRRMNKLIAVDRVHLARKGIAFKEKLLAERARAQAAYGAPRGTWAARVSSSCYVLFRFCGITLLAQIGEPAVPHSLDSRFQLAFRQVAKRRSRMSIT